MQLEKIPKIQRSVLRSNEVAVYLDISMSTLYKLVREKKLIHFRIGSNICFKKEAVDNWIEEQMAEAMKNEY